LNVDTPLDDSPWHLRFHDETGRTFTRLATSRQVVAGLRAGLWPDGVEAARSEKRQFRPVREYPEFRPAVDGANNEPIVAVVNQAAARRYRRLFIVAGFGVGLLIAAAVASVIRGLLG
jgi:hypothetical protein